MEPLKRPKQCQSEQEADHEQEQELVLPLDMVDKSTSPLQPAFGQVFGDEAVQSGLLFPK
jgi:hypothetical protein